MPPTQQPIGQTAQAGGVLNIRKNTLTNITILQVENGYTINVQGSPSKVYIAKNASEIIPIIQEVIQ